MEKETIYTEEVALLMKGATYKEVIDFMEGREGEHEKDPFKSMLPDETLPEVTVPTPATTEDAEESEQTEAPETIPAPQMPEEEEETTSNEETNDEK